MKFSVFLKPKGFIIIPELRREKKKEGNKKTKDEETKKQAKNERKARKRKKEKSFKFLESKLLTK
ncbi:hypothetical protein Avbf_10407 [Armadillidium vulgare]|nr:hypothetical protein Avbf_10407 [Armadillidium vulgare]